MDASQPRRLGRSDVYVSPITFGAWALGGWLWGGADEDASVAAIQAGIDHGLTTIDTAALYAMGYGEQVVARAIKGRRNQVQIATKCGRRWDTTHGSDPVPSKDNQGRDVTILADSRPESIAYECEQSLKRLEIDYIDLYQVHYPDKTTPIEDSMAALVKLKDQGKIRAIGVSNYDVDQLARSAAAGPLASLQPPYSLIQRKIEPAILPFCIDHEIGILAYSPLERGLLAGAVPVDREFPPGDHRAGHRFFKPEHRERVLKSLEHVRPIAEAHGASLAQVVINWTAHAPGITSAIVGARTVEQAVHNAGALGFSLSDEERSTIRRAFDETSAAMM